MRKMSWVIIGWNVLMLVWIVSALAGSSVCEGETGQALEACQSGEAIGAGIGIAFVLFIAALGNIILGVLYLATNRSKRECPTCGKPVKKGLTVCKSCGYDFKTGASPA